ncbi:Rieske (2Fe-2S) protein [Pseudomonas taeanensis]|uniref:Rieske (2Fe-2S) protein n=1 Tax=Pseudomonas taeanensis TaxID=574962 RepID=UPI001F426B84|nr:Rieske (2Fe-2S) protein [Pseudomonas taeanensis]
MLGASCISSGDTSHRNKRLAKFVVRGDPSSIGFASILFAAARGYPNNERCCWLVGQNIQVGLIFRLAIEVFTLLFLCNLCELKHGSALGLDPWEQGRDTLLALLYDGRPKVYRNNCPHQNVPMQYRKDRFMSPDGSRIICFAHGASFRPDNGLCIDGPCLGQSLTSLSCLVDSEGRVWLES